MNLIQQLKQKPLVDFFETHLNISLTKSGNNYRCKCPIHTESNPSFYIYPNKNKCSCFGSCDLINGDIIDFTSKYKLFSINESIHWLATKYKIPHALQKPEQKTDNETYYDICNFVANYYHSGLLYKHNYTKLAVQYLRSRKLTIGAFRDYNLGYAPHQSEVGTWTFLTDELKRENYSLELCEKIGLVRKSKQNTYYDSFQGRIIFPIYDLQDRCIGFNTRILPWYEIDGTGAKQESKYLLSKESILFKKSNFIYGLNNSLKYIRKEDSCLIVEGCFDCYKIWSYGYKNTIPLLGGKLFINLKYKHGPTFLKGSIPFTEYFYGLPDVSTYVFLMDPDKAGINYSLENGAELIKWGKNVLICELKKDPDDCTKEEIDYSVRNTKSFLDFYLQCYLKYPTVEHKLQILDKLCALFNGIEREQVVLYALELSEKMKIPAKVILYRFGIENKLKYNEIFGE